MFVSKLKAFIYNGIYKKIMKFSVKAFYYLPIKKNSIVILRDWGLGYGCNPKYLSEYIIKNQLPFSITWVLNYIDPKMPATISQKRLSRIGSVYAFSRAQVVITTFEYELPVVKKKNQLFVFIPHGQAGAKPCFDEIPLSEGYRKKAMKYAAIQDLYVASSEYQAKDFVEYYWCKCEILRSGYPRNDIYFHNNNALIAKIRKSLDVPDGYKIAFYAPTFRDNGNTDAYSLELPRMIKTLEEKTGSKWQILVKLHPNLRYWYSKPMITFSDVVKDVTGFPDIQELFLISDLVVTDYSSTMFDFSLTRKPVFLFATDIDEFIKMRGLKDMFFKTPFPICRNNEELVQAINNFNNEEYQKRLTSFYDVYKPFDDGHACQRIMDRITEYASTTI